MTRASATQFSIRSPRAIALQWTGDNYDAVHAWLVAHVGGLADPEITRIVNDVIWVAGDGAGERGVCVPVGHWIVKPIDAADSIYAVDPRLFEALYAEAI